MTSEIVILPLKRYLIKFIQLDWDRIFELNDLNRDVDYTVELLRASLIYNDFVFAVPILINKRFKLTDANFPIPDSLEIVEKIRSSKIKDPNLKEFLKQDFQIVKIKIHSKFFPFEYEEKKDCQGKLGKEDWFYKIINSLLEESFNRYLVEFIYGNTPMRRLEELYSFTGLKENDIKKATLIRRYHRLKDKYKKRPTKEYKFDKERPNAYFFKILDDRFKKELSYSKIANKHNTSKSRVIRICQNEKIKYEYKRFCRGIK